MHHSYPQQISQLKNQVKVDIQDEHILRIESTLKSPFVYLDSKEGIIVIFGKSISDNVVEFFKPILEFIDNHFQDKKMIQVYFRIIYCGSASGKYLQLLVKKLDKIFLQGQNMNIFWFQEEENYDMYTDGQEYQNFTSIPFNIVELDDEKLDELDDFFSQL
jgi:hypothetical protein